MTCRINSTTWTLPYLNNKNFCIVIDWSILGLHWLELIYNIPYAAELSWLHFIHRYLLRNIDNKQVFCIVIDWHESGYMALHKTTHSMFEWLHKTTQCHSMFEWQTPPTPLKSHGSCWKTIVIFPWPRLITDRSLKIIGWGVLKLSSGNDPAETKRERKTLTNT